MVEAIKNAIDGGMTQKMACNTFSISVRKYRRWAKPKTPVIREAWNKIMPAEKEAIIETVYKPEFLGKPISHIFVHGHDSNSFYASIPTIYRVLKEKSIVRQLKKRRKTNNYISAHELLDTGFSLLCYDGTRFVTDTGIAVWGIPVLLLPHRYLLHIGHAISSVTAKDLKNAVDEAYAQIPGNITENIIAHSDRGSAMKASIFKMHIEKILNAPVHYGRPQTPDDEAWIEAFIKTLKYHRDAPSHFGQVADVVNWFGRVPSIYNNDPHSSLSYVTPSQSLSGLKEVILEKRKNNLLQAKQQRLSYYYACKNLVSKQVKEEIHV